MADKYRNYKLSSGDEIIGKVISINARFVTVHRPMAVKTITIQNPNTGNSKDITLMRPWANLSNSLDHKIPTRHIILESSPTPEAVGAYLSKLERDDVVHDLVQEMMNDPEQLEEYLTNIIESEFDNNFSSEDSSDEEEENINLTPEDLAERVQMNFAIPPGLFLGFLMNGIISFDPENEGAEFDIEEFMKMKNKLPKKNQKDKDIEDYFRDWNPEP